MKHKAMKPTEYIKRLSAVEEKNNIFCILLTVFALAAGFVSGWFCHEGKIEADMRNAATEMNNIITLDGNYDSLTVTHYYHGDGRTFPCDTGLRWSTDKVGFRTPHHGEFDSQHE